MTNAQQQHVQLLFSQHRFSEAEKLLLDVLERTPDAEYAQYLLVIAYISQGKLNESERIVNALLTADPGDLVYLELKAELCIQKERFDEAADIVKHLIQSDPDNDGYFYLMANIKFRERYYDSALKYCDEALARNPDNTSALNLRLTINSQLGNREQAIENVKEVLQRNPEDPHSIANHGLSLLNAGKVDEALEKFQESLSINPNQQFAKYGMMEAMKSKFWPYKLFYQFGLLMSRMSGQYMWVFIIGAYLGLRFLRRIADSNPDLQPFLNPIIHIVIFLFVLTWVLDPIMNIYLLSNKYGRMLLDDDTKKSAKYCGISLIASLAALLMYFINGHDDLLMTAILFFAFLIPLGTMFKPDSEKNKKRATQLAFAIIITGIGGMFLNLLTGSFFLTGISLFGIFIYQWIINGMLIRDSSRRFEDY